MQKTVFFLDIDGPVASHRSALVGLKADPVAVTQLNELFSQPNLEVVISSTFRITCLSADDARNKLFNKYGISVINFHTNWRTGTSFGCANSGRSREITEWLTENKETDVRYVALDDDPVIIPDVIHIKTDYEGLTSVNLLELKALYSQSAEKRLSDFKKWIESRLKNSD